MYTLHILCIKIWLYVPGVRETLGQTSFPEGISVGLQTCARGFFPSGQAPGQAGRPLSQRDSGVSVHSLCAVPSGWWPAKNCLSVAVPGDPRVQALLAMSQAI